MEIIGAVWNEVIIRPMINSLVLLYYVFFNSFGLSIIAFTILVRSAMIPLTLKQSRQMRAMSAIQPEMKKVQERFPNDRARVQKEMMRLYKEKGVNPLGCLGTMFILGALFVLGGDSLTDFALALLIGLLVGPYSSVFTATT